MEKWKKIQRCATDLHSVRWCHTTSRSRWASGNQPFHMSVTVSRSEKKQKDSCRNSFVMYASFRPSLSRKKALHQICLQQVAGGSTHRCQQQKGRLLLEWKTRAGFVGMITMQNIFYVEHCLPLNSPRKIPCRAPQSQKGSPGMVAFFKVSDCLKKRFLLQVGCVQTQCWYWLWPLVPLHGVVLDMWLQVQDPKASPKCSFVMASTHQAFPSTQVEQYWTPKRHCFSLLPSKPVVCGDFCLVPHTQGFFGAGWHIFFFETKFFIIWWLFTGSCRAEYPPGKPLDLETTKDHCVFAIWKIWMKVYGINWGRMTPSLWHRKPL